jgi:hypothetical protein
MSGEQSFSRRYFPCSGNLPLLWSPKVHYSEHKSPPLVSVQGRWGESGHTFSSWSIFSFLLNLHVPYGSRLKIFTHFSSSQCVVHISLISVSLIWSHDVQLGADCGQDTKSCGLLHSCRNFVIWKEEYSFDITWECDGHGEQINTCSNKLKISYKCVLTRTILTTPIVNTLLCKFEKVEKIFKM